MPSIGNQGQGARPETKRQLDRDKRRIQRRANRKCSSNILALQTRMVIVAVMVRMPVHFGDFAERGNTDRR